MKRTICTTVYDDEVNWMDKDEAIAGRMDVGFIVLPIVLDTWAVATTNYEAGSNMPAELVLLAYTNARQISTVTNGPMKAGRCSALDHL